MHLLRKLEYIFLSFTICAPIAFAQSVTERPRQTAPSPKSYSGCTESPESDSLAALCVPASQPKFSVSLPGENLPPATIALQVPPGTPLRIAISDRVRITHAGTVVRGAVVDAVYAFDQIVIPAGSVASGRVTNVEGVPWSKRSMAYANGNFSPFHKYDITFDLVTLPDGRVIPIRTTVSPGAAEVVHLVSDPNREQHKNVTDRAAESAKREAKGKIQESKDELHRSWAALTAPGKLHRLKQFVLQQSPYRREYLEPGTRFAADLNSALNFGEVMRSGEQLAAVSSPPPADSVLKARLEAEVSSATAQRGTPVRAILTEPLYSASHQLILPANSVLVGEVVQAKPARKLHHNGELRLLFERIETPEIYAQQDSDGGVANRASERNRAQALIGNLEGVQVNRDAHLKLDEEGGARATDSRTRYLSTGLALMIAAAAAHPDAEHGTVDQSGDPGVRTVSGGSGFRLVGAVVSLAAKSTPVSAALGVYGAGSSVYANFLSRGREVVFPKDTPLEIGFGAPHGESARRNQK
ncbi:MAG TPA: hypothetical protein VGI16_05805 [Candidatus Acidoferrum sp.]|jgi:hypothetical protein